MEKSHWAPLKFIILSMTNKIIYGNLSMNLKCGGLIPIICLALVAPSFAALLVDDCNGNGLGGHWTSFSDTNSTASPKPFIFSPGGYKSDLCAKLEFELKPGLQYPYAGVVDNFTSQDLSGYQGVRFWAKGLGNWNCLVPIPATAAGFNH